MTQHSAHRAGRTERLLRALGRLAAGLALIGVAALLLVRNPQLRTREAQAVAWATSLATGTKAIAVNQTLAWGLNPGATAHALRVTYECTSAFLLGPLLLGGALVAAVSGRRFRLRRILTATAIGAAVAFGINVARLTMIAWAIDRWGESGYEWSHVVAGSVVTIIGATTAVAIFLVIVMRGGRRGRATCSVT